MYPRAREVARAAWATRGPLRVLDPNVRPRLLRDPEGLRRTIEEFASTADLVKLSEPDAATLFALEPAAVARHLRAVGARAVDTTGAGDACVAALMYGLLSQGWPVGAAAWADLVGFATVAASLACTVPGGATAMPTLDQIRAHRV